MGIRVDAIYGWTGNLKGQISVAVTVGEQSNQKQTANEKNMVLFFAFAWLAVVKPPEGLVFGDVWVEEL